MVPLHDVRASDRTVRVILLEIANGKVSGMTGEAMIIRAVRVTVDAMMMRAVDVSVEVIVIIFNASAASLRKEDHPT